MSRYLTLEGLYTYFPPLATEGPKDEQLRSAIVDAEEVVDADLAALGYEVPISEEEALPEARRLVLFRVLADLLSAPISPHINPQLAAYYEEKYQSELLQVAAKPSRLPGVARTVPILERFPAIALAALGGHDVEDLVESTATLVMRDLESLGYDTTTLDGIGQAQLERLIFLRIMSEVLVSPSFPNANAQLGAFYEEKYQLELRTVAHRSQRMGKTSRTAKPELMYFQPRKREGPSLQDRVRRWLEA